MNNELKTNNYNIATIADELDRLQARREILLDDCNTVKDRINETADMFLIEVYDKVLKEYDDKLTQIYREMYIKERQLNNARCELIEDIYRQLHDDVNKRNKLVDSNKATTDIYDDTLFSISVGDNKIDIPLFAMSFDDVCALLENLYEVYDGDVQKLNIIEQVSLDTYYNEC